MKTDPEFVNTDGTNKENPATREAWKHTALMGVAAKRWNALTEKQSQVYHKMAAADKARYERELAEYKANDEEFYTMENGSKSNQGLKSKNKLFESPRFAEKENDSPPRKMPSKVKEINKMSKKQRNENEKILFE